MRGCGSGPGRAPRETPSGVGQKPSACFQETHEAERVCAGLGERWVGGPGGYEAEPGPRQGPRRASRWRCRRPRGSGPAGAAWGPGCVGPGVRERAQPAAALQQGSWGLAGLTVPQAVCLLRVRSHVWPVDSPHIPVSFITECNLGFPANVTRRENHRMRSGSRLISRSWGVVLAGTAHALRLD